MSIRVEKPFPAAALPRVWQWMSDFRSRVADDYAPQTLDDFVEWNLARARKEHQFAVYNGEELCGLVTVEPQSPVAAVTHALFRKDFWGRDTTAAALRLVYAEAFGPLGLRKLVGPVLRDNHSIIALAMMLGAKREGMLRQQTTRGGKPADMVLLGLLKEDFERCNSQAA